MLDVNTFDQLRGQLRDELGVDPGEPLQRLQQQVLTHDPTLDMPLAPDSVKLTVSGVSMVESALIVTGTRMLAAVLAEVKETVVETSV